MNIHGEQENYYDRILSKPYAAGLCEAQRLTLSFLNHPNPGKALSNIQGVTMTTTIIVFSHLRWDFVYQRPQHLLSRLAENYKIIFIEEPIFCEQGSFLESSVAGPNITVLKPHTPISIPGFHDEQLPYLIELMRQFVVGDDDQIAWFYTPMALPLLQELQSGAGGLRLHG